MLKFHQNYLLLIKLTAGLESFPKKYLSDENKTVLRKLNLLLLKSTFLVQNVISLSRQERGDMNL